MLLWGVVEVWQLQFHKVQEEINKKKKEKKKRKKKKVGVRAVKSGSGRRTL
jgi:hypothetical protein